MSLDEAVELLVRGSGGQMPPSQSDKEAVTALAKELGCHPIALSQAISYMSNTGYTTQTYISRLCSYREQLLKDPATNQLDMRYLTAFAAFDASHDILPSKAQKILHLLSFFHRRMFPLDLILFAADGDFSIDNHYYVPHGEEFHRGKEYLKEVFCSSGEWSLRELDSIVISLRNQSLVDVVSAPDVTLLEMHSLVHEWTRFRIPQGILKQVRAAAIRLLCCGATGNNYRMMQYLSSHVQMHSSSWESLHTNDTTSFAFILFESGMYADAARLRERGYNSLKDRLGLEHLHTINVSLTLANTYAQLGRYADAEVLHIEGLRQLKQLLGTEHPDTITASASLAVIYRQLGRYSDAEVLGVEALRELKRLLGSEHPDTIRTSANLAATYNESGRYADAELLGLEALRQLKQLLGTEHPDTIKATANLATTYNQLGRYEDAEPLDLEVLRSRKRLLGAEHPDTISGCENLAIIYSQLGRYAESKVLRTDVIKLRTKVLGSQHPDTLLAVRGLARMERVMHTVPL
jgi:tetratricopeptide (TPR) repeat protein